LLVCVSPDRDIASLKYLARDDVMVTANQDCAHLNANLSLRMPFLGFDLSVRRGTNTWIAEVLVEAGFLQRLEKIFRVRRLYNISQSTCTKRLRGHLRRFVLTEDHYLGLGKNAADFPSGIKTIHIGHAEIHENEIGQQYFCLLYCIVAVHCFATDVNVSLCHEEGSHSSSHYFVVIHYENSQSTSVDR
jgi:hypothetical protein